MIGLNDHGQTVRNKQLLGWKIQEGDPIRLPKGQISLSVC